jgi:hypothetical protein
VSWTHHWTLAVPALLLVGVCTVRSPSRAGVAAFALAAAAGLSHVIWWVPVNHPPHSELHLDAVQLVWADAYVLLGALALAGAAWSARRGRARAVRLAI